MVEFLIALALITVVFAITFEMLRDYLGLYKQTLGDLIRLEDMIKTRSFLGVHLRERTKGLSLHPASGGAIPLGRQPGSNQLIGGVWVSNGGKSLYWLESLAQASSGSLVYAWAEGNLLHLIVSGVNQELYEKAKLVVVSGIPVPSTWEAQIPHLPLPPPNYPSPCYGFVARVVNNVLVEKEDIPENAPEANFYRKNINFTICRRITVQVESLPTIQLPREPSEIIADVVGIFVPPQEKPGIKVGFSDGVRKLEITAEQGLVAEMEEQKKQILLRRQTLGTDVIFRYIESNLEEKTVPPDLKEQIGVSFSGSYTPPETGVRGLFYIPLIVEDWSPAL